MNIIKFIDMIMQGATIKDKINIIRFILFNTAPLTVIENKVGKFYCASRYQAWAYNYNEANTIKKIVAKNLNSGEIFIDVGANIGAISFLGSKIVGKSGKVYAFEPEEKNLHIFQKNISFNNLNNINLVPLACTEKSGFATFNISKNSGEHSLGETISPSNIIKSIKIKTISLDDFTKKNNINKIKLIKIDVEGQELSVLRGAKSILKKASPKLLFECWDKNKFEAIAKLLDSYNYKIKKVTTNDFIAFKENN